MSEQLISRSPDLKRLRDEGYEVEISAGYLLVKHIPYVTGSKNVHYGTLVSKLDLSGDVTTTPSDHVVMFRGEVPCDKNGRVLTKILNSSSQQILAEGLVVDHTFSSKPPSGYPDYYEKMSAYIAILEGPAHSLDPSVTARTFAIVENHDEESVFRYMDTASSRAGIAAANKKLELDRIAIVGLGGSGSYVLDLVAKTPVRDIHIFDGDVFGQHNAFRSPGAASIEDLRLREAKVSYFERQYARMRRRIVAHAEFVDESNVDELCDMEFVFICMDRGDAKKLLISKLEEFEVAFVDVGMGVDEVDGVLSGLLRVTTSTSELREHVWSKQRIPFSDGEANNDYSRNIQIADLNALNAALAVIKWKKLVGFYQDLEREHFCAYAIDGNHILNEDIA